MDNIIDINSKNKGTSKEDRINQVSQLSNKYGDLIIEDLKKGVDVAILCAIIGDRLGELVRVSTGDKEVLTKLIVDSIKIRINT